MHEIMYYLHVVIAFFREGFHEGFARVNALLGLIVAIFAAYMMPAWKRIWAITLGAAVGYLVAAWALPILDNRAPFRLPSGLMELSYWRAALMLYLGFLVVITIFFFLKTRVLPKPGGGGGKH